MHTLAAPHISTLYEVNRSDNSLVFGLASYFTPAALTKHQLNPSSLGGSTPGGGCIG